jgi:hypothetical protein
LSMPSRVRADEQGRVASPGSTFRRVRTPDRVIGVARHPPRACHRIHRRDHWTLHPYLLEPNPVNVAFLAISHNSLPLVHTGDLSASRWRTTRVFPQPLTNQHAQRTVQRVARVWNLSHSRSETLIKAFAPENCQGKWAGEVTRLLCLFHRESSQNLQRNRG